MTLRITPQMVDNSTLQTITNDLNQLDNTQQQLSTGYRINQPSDNPYGAALSLSLNAQITAFGSYQQNIDQGIAWVQTASQSLQSIQSVAQSIRTLTVEGANSTLNATDLANAGQEVLQYIGQIKETADTQYNGSYIFSGTAVNTQPYNQSASGSDTFQGNTGTINYAIGPSTTLPVNANLYTVLGDGVGPSGAFTPSGVPGTPGTGGLLASMRAVYNDLTGTSGGTQADLSNQLTNLDANIKQLELVQAQVGATQDRLQMASSRITALQTTDTTELGNVRNTDFAAATVTFSTEQAGYQAALQSTASIIQTSLLNFIK